MEQFKLYQVQEITDMSIETLIVVSGLFVCVVVAYLVYNSRAHWFAKLLALPLVLALTTTMVYTALDRMGAPIEAQPIGKFKYLHHALSADGGEIFIWIYTQERGHRLHVVPYSRETAKALNEAKQKANDGKQQVGSFGAKDSASPNKHPNSNNILKFSDDDIDITRESFQKN